MKTTMIKMAVTGAMAGLVATTAWAGNMGTTRPHGQGAGMAAYAMTLPAGDLSDAETVTLLHMREEEKLSRDVYTALYDTWNHWAFERISQSEQRHMDAVLALMEKYGVADPVTDDATGSFADADMAALYGEMVDAGGDSLAEALRVGATIEDLDISDLQKAIAEADDEDLSTVYQNLLKGSRNHLRTFVYQLGVLGETYTPQYISEEDFTAIVTSPRERGMVDADGNPVITGGGQQRSGGCKRTGSCPYLESDDADSSEDLSVTWSMDRMPLLAKGGNGNGGNGNGGGGNGGNGGGGQGPGDGTGNDGDGPKDGTGNGKKTGTCIYTDAIASDTELLLTRGGNGNGGNGPGNGKGNGGQGPKDGSGNGRKRGTCIYTDIVSADAELLLSSGDNGNGGYGPGDGTGNGGDGPKDGTGNGKTAGDCTSV